MGYNITLWAALYRSVAQNERPQETIVVPGYHASSDITKAEQDNPLVIEHIGMLRSVRKSVVNVRKFTKLEDAIKAADNSRLLPGNSVDPLRLYKILLPESNIYVLVRWK